MLNKTAAVCRSNLVKDVAASFLTSAQRATVAGAQLHTSPHHDAGIKATPVTKPEGTALCTMLPGDGVGPELMHAVQEVFKAAGVPVKFEGFYLSETNPTISAPLEDVVNSINKNGICLKGTMATPQYTYATQGHDQGISSQFKNNLNLFANVVHVKSNPGIPTRHKNLDFIIVREQMEGEYSALEHESVPGVVECLKIITRKNSHRIAKFAFDYATKHGRSKVTAVHKANIMKLGDGLFLQTCKEVSEMYPKIAFDNMIIDNCSMQMVSHPHQFDVLVMPNLYGSILENLAAGLVGGAGVLPGSSYSHDCVVYEPGARHTFTEGVGKNIANPIAMLKCAVKMLKHINLDYHSKVIDAAIEKTIKSGRAKTKDLGGHATTTEFTMHVIANL